MANLYLTEQGSSLCKAMKRYFAQYEAYMGREFKHPHTGENTTLRKCFRIQAERLARNLTNKDPYTTFIAEG